MDPSGIPRFPVHGRQLQSASLSALADDASSLAAAQQALGGPATESSQSFQSYQPAATIRDLEQHRQNEIQHARHTVNQPNGSGFLRPTQPEDPTSSLLIAAQQQRAQQYQTDMTVEQQRQFIENNDIRLRGITNGANNEHLSLQNSQLRSMPETRHYHLDMLQTPETSPQQTQQEQNFQFTANNATRPANLQKRLKLVPNPPDLDLWREKLFQVDGTITLSEDQFNTYFPHIDNVYSHRSTQRYKRKPFVSYYWDCRLKGRPPGTPKSDDPNKKKRKRAARQRDLCDVKIKITEYFPGFTPELTPNEPNPSFPSDLLPGVNTLFDQSSSGDPSSRDPQPFGTLTPNPALTGAHPGANGERFFTIQRVNGNGANGKNDGIGGGHRHTLADSDRVKKNSVQRHVQNEVRNKRTISSIKTMAPQHPTSHKTYHTKATGDAAFTEFNHKDESDLKLFGSCFCPFVQRVWIALELKGLPYQYIEVDPYQKPQSLLDVNPRGLVPALRHGDWGCYESTVLMEYLDDLDAGSSILPRGDAKARAHSRLWADHINRHIVPNFYRVLQEQDHEKQISNARELRDGFTKLIDAAHPQGPFFLGNEISFVDIQVAPWILRLRRVLKPYRGWPDPDEGSRWALWVNAIEENEHVRATTSTDELYLDSYERYAQNRPNTSQVANAINSGRGLP